MQTLVHRNLKITLAACLLVSWLLPITASAADVAYITASNLKKLLQSKAQVLVIDVGTQEAFDAAHIKEAVHMSSTAINTANFPLEMKLVIYDASLDGQAAKKAADGLVAKGYKDVSVVQGGFLAWQAVDRPATRTGARNIVSPQQLLQAVKEKQEFLLVDLNRPELFESVHVPGAVNIAPKDINAASTQWAKNNWIVLYGDEKDKTAQAAVDKLRQLGFELVAYVPGGYPAIQRERAQPVGQ